MTDLNALESLYFAALAKAPDERAAFLDEACAGNAELRGHLERLLAAQPQVGAFLEPPVDLTASFDPPGEATAAHGPSEAVGAVLAGKYKLTELIGEGGMGSVWLAQQSEPVKRKVAVKLIKPGMDSRQVLARFEAERQALALMDHPNIAKVLDGGLHDGRPYFVMELVKGVPITEYCDARKLTPRERLELFVPVCQAIQHAHQKGVIHRDIKPSNVLIALYDDKPVPKVIDFGVAKATGGTLTEHTIETGFGGVVGTPQYMSPEQATLNNLDIDTRSDVYSLGVLLYELLTGSPPFSRKELEKQGLLEILRIVREEEPPKPSTKLSTADAVASLSANRGTEPKKLTALLRSELDWIVLKALEKDRTRRYETANGFAADINRYLAGEPVVAHPPSAGYRLKKFSRRNRPQLIVGAVVGAALAVGAAGLVEGYLRARSAALVADEERLKATAAAEVERTARAAEADQRARAEAEKKRADEEAAVARAVTEFLQKDLLMMNNLGDLSRDSADPDLKVRTLISRAATKLDGRFRDKPLVEATLRRTIGTALSVVGDPDQAVVHIERAVKLYADHTGGPDSLESLQALESLAQAYGSGGIEMARKASGLYARLLEAYRTRFGPTSEQAIRTLIDIGGNWHANEPDRAIAAFEELLRIQSEHKGPRHPDTLLALWYLQQAHRDAWQPERAIPYAEREVHERRAIGPADDDRLLGAVSGLARLYSDVGRHDEAIRLSEEVYRVKRAKFGSDPTAWLWTLRHVADMYRLAGHTDRAIQLYEEYLREQKAVPSRPGDGEVPTIFSLASLYRTTGRADDAVALLEEAIRSRPAVPSRRYGGRPLYWLITLADLHLAAGRTSAGLALVEEVIRHSRGAANPDIEDDTFIWERVAWMLLRFGHADRADQVCRDLVPALREIARRPPERYRLKGSGPTSPPSRQARLALALYLQGWSRILLGRPAEAEPVLRESLTLQVKDDPTTWLTVATQSLLGGALLKQGNYADAEPLLLAGYHGLKEREAKVPTGDKARLPEAADRLVELYTALNKPEETARWRIERAKYPEIAPPPRAAR